MLSYIASNSTANLINDICQELNITILNREVEEIDFLKYIKETKVNFNLIKYLIIDLSQIKNTEDEVINCIKYFKEIYINTRIIIIAKNYNNQNSILTNLYENKIYNIVNSNDEQTIKAEIKKCLSQQGLQEKDSRRFKKIEELKENKKEKYKRLIRKIKEKLKKNKKAKKQNKNMETLKQENTSVYFFAILLDAITRLVKLLCYFAVFILTSIGLTFLFNEELRNIVFQILGLK